MPRCINCKYRVRNSNLIPVRTKKGMMQPLKEYCQHPNVKHRIISFRATDTFGYPVWCPLAEATTCIVCGKVIRMEEGCYCKKCK